MGRLMSGAQDESQSDTTTSRRFIGLSAALLILCSAVTCAHVREQEARENYIHRETKNHLYDRSCDELGPYIEEVITAHGYEANRRKPKEYACPVIGDLSKTESGPPGYIVKLFDPESYQCRIEVLAAESSRCERAREHGRSLELEWKVLQKANPERAEEIRKEAERQTSN